MLYQVNYQNFFSFKELNSLHLAVNKKSPDTEKYFFDKTGKKLAKVQGVFGYNASGKTNALKAVSFLRFLILSAYVEDPEKKISVLPFKFTKGNEKATELSVVFSVEKDIYDYKISLADGKIANEVLKKKAFGKKRFSTLFERTLIGKKYILKDKTKLGFKEDDARAQRTNASIMATALRDGHEEITKIAAFWRSVHSNVVHSGKQDFEYLNTLKAAVFFLKNKNLKEVAENMLTKFDLGLSGVDIQEVEDDDGDKAVSIKGVHNKYKLPFDFESAGTKKFFHILSNILPALDSGGVVVFDEFDSDLHPIMAEEVLNLFFSPETNPHNAQFIFSAHHASLLNILDKYHITLTEKNAKGESESWRLDEMKGLRPDDNYYLKYITGAYGAVPDFK